MPCAENEFEKYLLFLSYTLFKFCTFVGDTKFFLISGSKIEIFIPKMVRN